MKVKGTAILSSINYIKERYGDEGLDRIKEKLTEDERHLLSEIILQSEWYPFQAYVDITNRIDSIFGTGDYSIARDIGAFEAERDLKTVYKIFYVLGSPEFIINQGSKIFSKYFDSAKMEVIESSNTHAIAELHNFPDYDIGVLNRIAGFIKKTLELSGGKDPKVNLRIEQKEGKKIAVFDTSWE